MGARNLVKLQWTVDAILMTEVFLVTAINEYLTISVVAVLFLSIVLRSMGIVVHLGGLSSDKPPSQFQTLSRNMTRLS